MESLDRSRLVELLSRLGAVDNQSVLEAARELHRRMTESGLTWDDMLRAEWDAVGAVRDAQVPLSEEILAGNAPVEAEGEVSGADKAEATRLIGRLLARKDISDNLRQELNDLKQTIVEGGFDAMDRRYIRALAKRLGT